MCVFSFVFLGRGGHCRGWTRAGMVYPHPQQKSVVFIYPESIASSSRAAIGETRACSASWEVVGSEVLADGCFNRGEEGYNCRLPLMEPLKLDSLHRTAVT